MLCSSFLFTSSGTFGYHLGGLNEVPIGVMECRDRDRTGVIEILDAADEDIGRKVQPESARPRHRSALTSCASAAASAWYRVLKSLESRARSGRLDARVRRQPFSLVPHLYLIVMLILWL
jgi:hypothetical protein